MTAMTQLTTDKIIKDFNAAKGKGYIRCSSISFIADIVELIVSRFLQKNSTRTVCIYPDTYDNLTAIRKRLPNVNFVTKDFIKIDYKYEYDLNLLIGYYDIDTISKLNNESKFCFYIQTKYDTRHEYIDRLNSILKDITDTNLERMFKNAHIYSPVEETHIRVELSDDDRKLYDDYTEYITTSLNLFGSFENVEKCRVGDKTNNISAIQMCNNIAKENGWRDDLDTTIEYQREIDKVFNPNSLYERANNFYNITKLRRDLVTDNACKLEAIAKIVKEHPCNKILIISKRGEYAANVTKYLNTEYEICGDYHDCIEPKVATDDKGNAILVKSGPNKGTPRIIKSQAISTLNEQRFNLQNINVLSIKNASDNSLKIACNMVIITSSLCDTIIDLKKRFDYIDFDCNPTKVYVICCNNTIESDSLIKPNSSVCIKVIDDYDNIIDFG